MFRSRLAATVALAMVATLAVAVRPAEADGPLPRIRSDGANFFYRNAAGERVAFVPRGLNYIRLGNVPGAEDFHSTFEQNGYSDRDADAMLRFMQHSGYNVVRVFIDPGGPGMHHGIGRSPGEGGLNQAYRSNVEWFIRQAINRGIYVMPVFDFFPTNAFYDNTYVRKGGRTPTTQASGTNLYYMDPGYIEAKQAYLWYFVSAMRARLGPANLTAIFAYELDNEVFWHASEKPFNTPNVPFTGPNGLPYQMQDNRQRQRAADESLDHYAGVVAGTLVGSNGIDPDGMVTMGFATNHLLRRNGFDGLPGHCTSCDPRVDYRYPGRPANVQSKLTFVDFHVYPRGGAYSIVNDLKSSEVQFLTKPYLIGELGATKAVYANNITAAAIDMRNKQVDSCTVGLGAKGWLSWTYDSDIVVPHLGHQDLFYSLLDVNGSGVINGQLAPEARLNPCSIS